MNLCKLALYLEYIAYRLRCEAGQKPPPIPEPEAVNAELLDACETLLSLCDACAKHEFTERWAEPEREAARAAIAKAKESAS